MEELRNLRQIYDLAVDGFSTYNGRDLVLPQAFKDVVSEINNNTISYNMYSAIIETKGVQNGVLNIYLPNQWFYIASYFTDFYNELQYYKKIALAVLSKDRLKELNGKALTKEEETLVDKLPLSEVSKSYLTKFVTDYSWWGGAKTIDRGDFYVSPILSAAKLVNASQSFVADLCAFLSNRPDMVGLLVAAGNKVEQDVSSTYQQIYYGAPGTGKSHTVKKQTEGESVVRTTFHPDSDYSTFVGCYKPTTKKVAMRDVTGKIIVENDGTQVTEDRIVYEFVDQAFLQAYIKAWKFYAEAAEGAEPKKQYLIIEEINRGNCAQIFGDLFQLLDRNGYGFSDYYIHADKDMQKHLSKAFNNIDIDESHRNAINSLYPKDGDVVAKVLSGEILLLPDNLYIWATMNTSDQSLFPIDSAFKRRWDWRFRPIVKGRDNSGKELDWKIKIGQNVCAWWDFLEKINAVIGTMTSSADKKLGFFFCKAEDGIISAETFVSKVIFYLWNDVFKDYGFEGSIFSDSEGTLDFDKFYGIDVDGEVVVQNDKIELFLTNLGLTLVDVDSVNENINNEGEVAENDGTSFEVVLDGERISEKTAIGTFLKVIEKVGIEKVAQLGLQVSGNPIISREKLAEDTPGGYGGSQKYINGYWFVTKFNNPTKRKFLMEIKEKLGVNIVVE